MRRFWIDTDTASDDAVALIMALRMPDVHVEGISVVSGNVPLEMGSHNARYTVELCGADTPVYDGAARPLLRPPQYAYFFHGEDGMGGMHYPAPRTPARKEHGVLALIDAVRRYPGEITLVTLGPLTNVALAVSLAPDISAKIKMCYAMAGAAATIGNVTPAAEFNVFVDPEAAEIVFQCGMPLLMVGWEHCRFEANLTDEDIARVRAVGTPLAHFVIDCNQSAIDANRRLFGDPALPLPDPVTMAIAIDSSVSLRQSHHHVRVETASEVTRGLTLVDQLNVTNKAANIEVCWQIDIPKWKEILYRCLR